jgi:diketogulonate reductase-like aldo/keto reductase
MPVNEPANPTFLYGTAWKEDETRRLVGLALEAGFRGIDTANQRKHYNEAGVGEALAEAYRTQRVRREELFLQTKFTFLDGQDQRLPYDPKAAIATQVQQSFSSSLEHLGTTFVDSYVLHGPSRRTGLGPADWEAWGAMEAIAADGRAKSLGVSNVSLAQLEALVGKAKILPSYVQNRCYASRGWDAEVRAFCARHAIRYQGFSLLTANPEVLRSAKVKAIAARHERTPSQVIFRFTLQVGMLPLTGTTDPAHMREDLDVPGFTLEDDEVRAIEKLG